MENRGFTLLELSVVLVIIGLLIGGVLVGQDMLAGAKVRRVAQDISRLSSAVNSFSEKYNGLPGDLVNATRYWGAANATASTCKTTQGTGTQTCNGNGDQVIGDYHNALGQTLDYEAFRAWQQLASAGLITGSYTGVSGSGSAWEALPGINVPTGSVTGTGYAFSGPADVAYTAAPTYYYAMPNKYFMQYGGANTAEAPQMAFATPTDMQALDSKLDDGLPGQGIIQTSKATAAVKANCVTGATPPAYLLSNAGVACNLIYDYSAF